jgi:hypothetical protein
MCGCAGEAETDSASIANDYTLHKPQAIASEIFALKPWQAHEQQLLALKGIFSFRYATWKSYIHSRSLHHEQLVQSRPAIPRVCDIRTGG